VRDADRAVLPRVARRATGGVPDRPRAVRGGDDHGHGRRAVHRLEGKPIGDGAVGFFGRIMLAEIGASEVRAYADHVAARGVARDTVRLALAPVKALLATAHEDGLIRSNPASCSSSA